MATKLEPFFLSIISLYIKGTTNFLVFRKVSKNVEEALKMLRINPYKVVSYLPFLLNSLPNINTLYITVLDAQSELSESQLSQINWIDSSSKTCDISKITRNYAQKVISLRFSASECPCWYLEDFIYLQKLIIENAEDLSVFKISIFKSLKFLKLLVLYSNDPQDKYLQSGFILNALECVMKMNQNLTINLCVSNKKTVEMVTKVNLYYHKFSNKAINCDIKKDFDKFEINYLRGNKYIVTEMVESLDKNLIRYLKVSFDTYESVEMDFSSLFIVSLKLSVKNTKQLFVRIPNTLSDITIIAPNQNVCVESFMFPFSFQKCEFDCNIAFSNLKRVIQKTQRIVMKNMKMLKLKSQKYFYVFGKEMNNLEYFDICCPFKELDLSDIKKFRLIIEQMPTRCYIKDVGCCKQLILGENLLLNGAFCSNGDVEVFGYNDQFSLFGSYTKIHNFNFKFIENFKCKTQIFMPNETKLQKSFYTEKIVINESRTETCVVLKNDELKRITEDKELLDFFKTNIIKFNNFSTKTCDFLFFTKCEFKRENNSVCCIGEKRVDLDKDDIVVYVQSFNMLSYFSFDQIGQKQNRENKSVSPKMKRINKATKENHWKFEDEMGRKVTRPFHGIKMLNVNYTQKQNELIKKRFNPLEYHDEDNDDLSKEEWDEIERLEYANLKQSDLKKYIIED
ncbi:hypothetical protein EIN_144580 [Entamoeba invadens IP1]|uniref:Uncharacterized protein n=1 Tax=Entamoeba invadens IP1 TaxID=370355 RepID=A0A0A1UCU1_ENTIV|nr:hypothetical protein EIN_144580 [Entamoeba invadens IP1]ELP91488.1 hypothetical protein EIN_144580 [Entamoeba invadens IP1]|eukprot:XP_004258259.1 hypothetical protein EIN_144580 [Entamoeba invadens IP1]